MRHSGFDQRFIRFFDVSLWTVCPLVCLPQMPVCVFSIQSMNDERVMGKVHKVLSLENYLNLEDNCMDSHEE